MAQTATKQPDRKTIQQLNDQLRIHGRGRGSLFVTAGVHALGEEFVRSAITVIRTFDDFNQDNDPWGEHDCAAVSVGGEKLFFKIDYYDPSMQAGSENPADASKTHRVLTIMLASEY